MITTFHAPKTAGCSSLVYNFSVAQSYFSPGQSVCLLEVSQTSHLPIISHTSNNRNWSHLIHFQKANEWNDDLMTQFPRYEQTTLIPSPEGRLWEEIETADLEALLNLLNKKFDHIYIDLGQNVRPDIQNLIFSQSQSIKIITCPDPLHQQSLDVWQTGHTNFSHKTQTCLNQCDPALLSQARQNQTYELVLPLATKPFARQIFEGIPVACQKKNPIKSTLESWFKQQ